MENIIQTPEVPVELSTPPLGVALTSPLDEDPDPHQDCIVLKKHEMCIGRFLSISIGKTRLSEMWPRALSS